MLHDLTELLVSYGIWGILILGFIDSAGIPVAMGMDALVIFVAANDPARGWLSAGMAVVGSLGGNLVLFLAARQGGKRLSRVEHVPGAEEPGRFRSWFDSYGLLTIFVPAVLPIPLPLKVFVITAGVLHTPLRKFVGVIVLARVIRYFGEAWLGIALGHGAAAYLVGHKWLLLGIAIGLGAGCYGWIRWRRESP